METKTESANDWPDPNFKPLGVRNKTETFYMMDTPLKFRRHISKFSDEQAASQLFCLYCEHSTLPILVSDKPVTDCCHGEVVDCFMKSQKTDMLRKVAAGEVRSVVDPTVRQARTSSFRGVCKLTKPYKPLKESTSVRCWRAQVVVPGYGAIALGDYISEIDAANVYDNAVFWLHDAGYLVHCRLNKPAAYTAADKAGIAKFARTEAVLADVKWRFSRRSSATV